MDYYEKLKKMEKGAGNGVILLIGGKPSEGGPAGFDSHASHDGFGGVTEGDPDLNAEPERDHVSGCPFKKLTVMINEMANEQDRQPAHELLAQLQDMLSDDQKEKEESGSDDSDDSDTSDNHGSAPPGY